MPLINCRVKISLKWIESCVLATFVDAANHAIANAVKATFRMKDTNLYVPVVTVLTEDSVKLTKQLSEGFKISV